MAELGARLQVTLAMVLMLVVFKLTVSTTKYMPITSIVTLLDIYMLAAFVIVALVALQNLIVYELDNAWP